jgi:hypothetical protein
MYDIMLHILYETLIELENAERPFDIYSFVITIHRELKIYKEEMFIVEEVEEKEYVPVFIEDQ